jgi:hypothetical protein
MTTLRRWLRIILDWFIEFAFMTPMTIPYAYTQNSPNAQGAGTNPTNIPILLAFRILSAPSDVKYLH